jgi:hypothetical protein
MVGVDIFKHHYDQQLRSPMLLYRRPGILSIAMAGLLLLATSCANSEAGRSVEESLQPDPRLLSDKEGQTQNASPASPTLPAEFPPSVPIYPDSQLQEVKSQGESGWLTQWKAANTSRQEILQYYQQQLQDSGWQLQTQTTDQPSQIVAQRDSLQLTVSLRSLSGNQRLSSQAATTFTLETSQPSEISETPTATPSPASQITPTPETTSTPSPTPSPSPTSSPTFSDLEPAPEEIRSYIRDLAKLGILEPATETGEFQPNQPITRRTFARWLFLAHNKIYAQQPGQRLRQGVKSSQPVFGDVPTSDRDFAPIQGLAEAGIIPYPQTGEDSQTQFNPDQPLTRSQLLRWKVPLDVRKSLPAASVDAVKEKWGFQDAQKINSETMRALLADYKNGDLSNVRRAFGYTRLFQPSKPVTRAEAAAALWYFGSQGEGLSAKNVLEMNSSGTSHSG